MNTKQIRRKINKNEEKRSAETLNKHGKQNLIQLLLSIEISDAYIKHAVKHVQLQLRIICCESDKQCLRMANHEIETLFHSHSIFIYFIIVICIVFYCFSSISTAIFQFNSFFLLLLFVEYFFDFHFFTA